MIRKLTNEKIDNVSGGTMETTYGDEDYFKVLYDGDTAQDIEVNLDDGRRLLIRCKPGKNLDILEGDSPTGGHLWFAQDLATELDKKINSSYNAQAGQGFYYNKFPGKKRRKIDEPFNNF